MGSLKKGSVFFVSAKAVFLLSSYAMHVGLGRILGPGSYGVFGVVFYLVSLLSILVGIAFSQAAERFTAVHGGRKEEVKRALERLALAFSLGVAVLYFFLAGKIALWLGNQAMAPLIRLSALILPFYSIYSLDIGILNGMLRFRRRAYTESIFGIARAAMVLGLVLIGFGLKGAFYGLIAGTAAAFLYGRGSLKMGPAKRHFPYRELVDFALPVVVFSVLFSSLFSIDLFFVSRLLESGEQAGYYAAGSNLARVPFYLVGAAVPLIMPVAAKAFARWDIGRTRGYVRDFTRYQAMVLLLGIALLGSTAEGFITLLYSESFAAGAQVLRVLVIGTAFMTLFSLYSTTINSLGATRVSMAIALLAVAVDAVLNILLIPRYQLEGAAIATTLSAFLALSLSFTYIARKLGGVVELAPLLKMLAPAGLVFALASYIEVAGVGLVVLYLGLGTVYFGILAALGEVNIGRLLGKS